MKQLTPSSIYYGHWLKLVHKADGYSLFVYKSKQGGWCFKRSFALLYDAIAYIETLNETLIERGIYE